MEYLDGETLRSRFKKQGPLGAAAFPIIRQMATALAATHAKNIVHRDLKPDNVMLVSDPEVPGGERVKILDFGIAKLLADAGGDQKVRTRTGTMMGTPTYMSPEQCRGNADVRQPSDVYSLGAMLFELYAGRPPFVSDGFGELVGMHMFEAPPTLSSLVNGVPEALERLITDMLAKDPSARPTMTQVAERLLQIPRRDKGSAPSSSGVPPTLTGSVSGTTIRHEPDKSHGAPRRTGVVYLSIVLLVILGLGSALWMTRSPQAITPTLSPAQPVLVPPATPAVSEMPAVGRTGAEVATEQPASAAENPPRLVQKPAVQKPAVQKPAVQKPVQRSANGQSLRSSKPLVSPAVRTPAEPQPMESGVKTRRLE
jgi:serine/threonine protein kinase